MMIPEKVVSRLGLYRRLLASYLPPDKEHIFSHELAALAKVTPVQLRRDLMRTSYQGNANKGYRVEDLKHAIGLLLDPPGGVKMGLVGVGRLGSAVLSYFRNRTPALKLVAAFDIEPDRVNKLFHGVPCHHFAEIAEVVQEKGIIAAIISVPGRSAQEVADTLVRQGVRGILNFAPTPLEVPPHVYLEEVDLTMAVEKVAYHALATTRLER
jgi:redox-sensing transcriptional repressor